MKATKAKNAYMKKKDQSLCPKPGQSGATR
jgi:hypothetical protein